MDRSRSKSSASSPHVGEEASSSGYSFSGLRILREQAEQRLGQVVAAVRRWWSALSGTDAPTSAPPKQPADLAQALKTLDQQLATQEFALNTDFEEATRAAERCAETVGGIYKNAAIGERSRAPVIVLESDEPTEESEEQILVRLKELQRQEEGIARSLARIEPDFDIRNKFNNLATARVRRFDKRVARLEARVAETKDEELLERLTIRLKGMRTDQRIRQRVLSAIAEVQVPWQYRNERSIPHGIFASPVVSLLGPATIVGAGGSLSEIDWTDPTAAIAEATARLVEQTPAIQRGSPRKHVGHLIIALPQWEGDIPFVLTPTAAMRLARQALLSQGAEPDLHDFVVFVHQKRRANGDKHDEEAVHVVWSKVRVDGKYLVNDNALISALVGRVRWDRAAGFDEGRMGTPTKEHYCVRRGLRILNRNLLTGSLARYNVTDDAPIEIPAEWDEKKKKKFLKRLKRVRKDPDGLVATYRGSVRGEDETVDFFSDGFLARLSQEGLPESLFCAGVWTPKKCIRSANSIASLLTYLYKG